MRIAFLHLAPLPGKVAYNQRLIETGIAVAVNSGAELVLTPELATTGYSFSEVIGTDWIVPQPDAWMLRICDLAGRHGTAIVLGHVERDAYSGALHNCLFAISATGELLGRHRKVRTLRVGSEAWSTAGDQATVLELWPDIKVGLLLCADACSVDLAQQMKAAGALLLLSGAAWMRGQHGPDGEWERITQETRLPLFVCNRTGEDLTLNFSNSESVVVHQGTRRLSMESSGSAVFVLDWDLDQESLESDQPLRFDIPADPTAI